VPTFYHVTASRNRESIERYGLDWSRMGSVSGIAGSRRPEVDGVFLCRDDGEVEFFCRMNAAGGPVDVWQVNGVGESDLILAPEGFVYLPRPVPIEDLRLVQSMRLPEPDVATHQATGGYQSTLTVTLDDGRVLRDAEAHEWLRRDLPAAE
jgi:hypothetical protein